MKKECIPVFLSTEDSDSVKLYLNRHDELTMSYDHYHKPQHLYITSDDEFKVGDLVYSARGFVGRFGEFENSYKEECKKIIAASDNSLEVPAGRVNLRVGSAEAMQMLPGIPMDFIQAYVESNGVIDKILVTYWDGQDNPVLTIDNEIIISSIEDELYSEEEVKRLMQLSIGRGIMREAGYEQEDPELYTHDNEWIARKMMK